MNLSYDYDKVSVVKILWILHGWILFAPKQKELINSSYQDNQCIKMYHAKSCVHIINSCNYSKLVYCLFEIIYRSKKWVYGWHVWAWWNRLELGFESLL